MKVIQVDGGQAVVANTPPTNSIGVLYPAGRVDFIILWSESTRDADTEVIIELDDEYVLLFSYINLLFSFYYFLEHQRNIPSYLLLLFCIWESELKQTGSFYDQTLRSHLSNLSFWLLNPAKNSYQPTQLKSADLIFES
jgi:hypothetical protein